jgi:hypothetical protein
VLNARKPLKRKTSSKSSVRSVASGKRRGKSKPLARKVPERLTGEEINLIISACAAAKVSVLEVPGLRIAFGEGGLAKLTPAHAKTSEPIKASVPEMTAKQHARQTEDSIKLDEAHLKEERLALMAIEDPLEYERLIMNGELKEATDDDEEALI